MKPKTLSKYFAAPCKIFTTVSILLTVVWLTQFIVIEAETTLRFAEYRSRMIKEDPNATEKRLKRICYSEKAFLPDGTVHLIYNTRYERRSDGYVEEIYDVNDTLLWSGSHKDRPYEYLSWAWAGTSWYRWGDGCTSRTIKDLQMIMPSLFYALETPVNSQKETVEIWRYEIASQFFVGYKANGNPIGYIGANGFVESQSQAVPFGELNYLLGWCPQDSFSPTLLWQTNNHVYQINFEKQEVELLLEETENDIEWIRVNNWGFTTERTSQVSTEQSLPLAHYLTEDNKHHLLMRQPDKQLTISVPEDWQSDEVKLTAAKDGVFLYRYGTEARAPRDYLQPSLLWRQWQSGYERRNHKDYCELYKVDDEGAMQLLNRFEWVVPARDKTQFIDFTAKSRPYVTAMASPVYEFIWSLFGERLWRFVRNAPVTIEQFAKMVEVTRPSNRGLNWALSVIMMVIAAWHGWGRRTSWGKIVFWIGLVGVFNLAGLLTYLALNHTAVIRCSLCGRRRGLDRPTCVRCGAELAKPEQKDTDLVFTS